MKKVSVILILGLSLIFITGCKAESLSNAPKDTKIVEKVSPSSANLFITIDSTKENEKLKVYFDDKLCSDGIVVGEMSSNEYTSYPLKVDKGFYNIEVAIKDKIHSTLRLEVTDEHQRVNINYYDSEVIFIVSQTPKFID